MKRRQTPSKPQETGQFRVISGKHRGRKLQFPAVNNLRPTPDRVRETIFNWLFDQCLNANCLDLFAGAGTLGIEALSRHAQSCTFIEQNTLAAAAINSNLNLLKESEAFVLQQALPEAITQLASTPLASNGFDMIFIDPPYQLDIIAPCISVLLEKKLINPGAWIYVENASKEAPLNLPPSFNRYREKIFGQVRSTLFQYEEIS